MEKVFYFIMFIFLLFLKMGIIELIVFENLIVRKSYFRLKEATEGGLNMLSEEKFLNRLTPFKFIFVSSNSNINMTIIIPKSFC